ncbi:MAG: hypothetical protein ABSC37_06235 [Xanthobacteraceae bacterium]
MSELENERQFVKIMEEDIAASLGTQDRMGAPDWPSRSVVVTTSDLPALKRNLVYSSIMVDVS